jgi:Polyketide cyclase / dehydrase and lipid transport
MAYAELSMRFAASADRVWSALTGAELIPVLLETYAANIEIDGGAPGPGAILVTTLRKGGTVREKIESIDNEERCMRYRVLDAGPLPYANYRGEARVQPSGPDGAVVSFQCNFVPVDVSEVEARQYWTDHNIKVLNALRAAIEKR